MNNKLSIFLKGILMGISDLIPGISGGTIAFIVGIYSRLILAIKNISYENYLNLFKSIISNDISNKNKLFKKLDVLFLFYLFLGIFISIIFGSHLILFLVENFYVYVFSFFIGLILASSQIIFSEIKVHNKINFFFLIIGFILGFSLLFLVPSTVSNPSFLYIFIAGFLAIFALFLPGISGSFILVILGLYEFIINSIKDIFNLYKNIIPFGIGAILGVFVISRLITYLFEKDKSKTLYFLFGLVLGTLIIPIRNIYFEINKFTFFLGFELFILFILGFVLVKFIEKN